MLYILSGILGYLILLLFDWAAIEGRALLKTVIWFVGGAIVSLSVVMVILTSERILLPRPVSIAGWLLAAAFLVLLVYSLFVEIPLRNTYFSAASVSLVTTGTYALTRHPGVLWLVGLLVSLFLGSGAKLLLVGAPAWVLLDILYVTLQDRLYFPRIFGEAYARYREEVPMLLPTRASLKRCIETLRPSHSSS